MSRQRAIYLQKEFQEGGILEEDEDYNWKRMKKIAILKYRKLLEKKGKYEPHTFRGFCEIVVERKEFKFMMMVAVVLNILLVCVELNETTTIEIAANNIFLGIYTFEFWIRFYVDYFYFTRSGYDFFDLAILVLSYFDLIYSSFVTASSSKQFSVFRVFRSLRAMRLFRSVGFIRKLRLIVNALGKTLRNSILNVTILLVLMMFIFVILGYYLFGQGSNGVNAFSSISAGFFSLFRFVTAESWLQVQTKLNEAGYSGSQWYSISFMFIGNVVLSNLFIGVICENIDEATAADEQEQFQFRISVQNEKKKLLAQKQEEDMKNLFKTKVNSKVDTKEIDKLLEQMAGKLDGDEYTPMRHFYFHPTWLNTYLITLNNEMLLMIKNQQGFIRLTNNIKEYQDMGDCNDIED
eukprot:NODE_564_length_6635_cov_0.085985.p2 type:complete len:407 gc:universal NODE_564_length_6635_cov_0.085985:2208-3428(+)